MTSAHLATAQVIGREALTGLALAHGYDTAFGWTAGVFAIGAVVGGVLLSRGPLVPGAPSAVAQGAGTTAQPTRSPTPPA